MRIALVDDSASDRAELKACLARYFSETGGSFALTEYNDPAAFLESYRFDFDFIIFDIDMPGLNGIEAAKRLREQDPRVTLMFVTNMPQYAVESYAVEAMDYMVKPVSYPDFHLKMTKAERYIRQKADIPLSLETAKGIVLLRSAQLLYLESRQHYLFYHTETETLRTRGKLGDVAERLLPYGFARAGESYLVNLARLDAIEGADIRIGKERIPLSRRYRSAFLSAFTRYMGGF